MICLLRFQLNKHTANINREGLNDENSNAGGCFIYGCSNTERTSKLIDRDLWTFLLTSDLQKHTYATFCTLHHRAMFRGIDENEAFLC